MLMLKSALPYVLFGVTLDTISVSDHPELLPGDSIFTGIKIPHPNTVKARNMFLSIRNILKKTVASNPISGTRSFSFVFMIGCTQANIPFPTGGGACFSSATFSFGAYTKEL